MPAGAYLLSLVALGLLLVRPQPPAAVPALAPLASAAGGPDLANPQRTDLPPAFWRAVLRAALPQLDLRGGLRLEVGAWLSALAQQAPYALLRSALPVLALSDVGAAPEPAAPS